MCARDQLRDPSLLVDAQDLTVEIGDVLDRGGEGGATMVSLQDRLVAQGVDVAADGLRRDREALRQRFDADEALAADQVDDLGAALIVAAKARAPGPALFASEHAIAGCHCKAKMAQLRTRVTARCHPSTSLCRSPAAIAG